MKDCFSITISLLFILLFNLDIIKDLSENSESFTTHSAPSFLFSVGFLRVFKEKSARLCLNVYCCLKYNCVRETPF